MANISTRSSFIKLVPKIVELLAPIFKAAKEMEDSEQTPKEAGSVAGHILSSINVIKVDEMFSTK